MNAANQSAASMVNARQREARGGSQAREERKNASRNNPAGAAGGINKSATQANLGSAIGAALGKDV